MVLSGLFGLSDSGDCTECASVGDSTGPMETDFSGDIADLSIGKESDQIPDDGTEITGMNMKFVYIA